MTCRQDSLGPPAQVSAVSAGWCGAAAEGRWTCRAAEVDQARHGVDHARRCGAPPAVRRWISRGPDVHQPRQEVEHARCGGGPRAARSEPRAEWRWGSRGVEVRLPAKPVQRPAEGVRHRHETQLALPEKYVGGPPGCGDMTACVREVAGVCT